MKQEKRKDEEGLYRSWSTEDLVRARTIDKDDYRPEAMALIIRELKRRIEVSDVSPSEKKTLLDNLVLVAVCLPVLDSPKED